MTHDRDQTLAYWNTEDVESMYDKNLLNAEIELVRRRIAPGAKILDAGCGEGEGTLVYSSIPGTVIHGADFSETRLRKAKERLQHRSNVALKFVDFLGDYELDRDYDVVVSQRFLINLMEWPLQQKVLLDLMSMLRPGGQLILVEGSRQGTDELNEVRKAWQLEPIAIKWHNLFLDEVALSDFMSSHGYEVVDEDGLGSYYLLTRAVRPTLDETLHWDSAFNRLASDERTAQLLGFGAKFSRLKLWVFEKPDRLNSG